MCHARSDVTRDVLPDSLANCFFDKWYCVVRDYSARQCRPALKFAHVLFSSSCFSSSRGGHGGRLCWSGYNNLPLLRALFTNRTRQVDRARPTHLELPRPPTAIDFSLEYCHHRRPRPAYRHRVNPLESGPRETPSFLKFSGATATRQTLFRWLVVRPVRLVLSAFPPVRPLVGRRTRYPVM